MLPACHRHRSYVTLCEASFVAHSGHFPVLRPRALRSAGRGKRMIFAQMAGLLAMPTLLPEGVLSAEGEDAQAVNSS